MVWMISNYPTEPDDYYVLCAVCVKNADNDCQCQKCDYCGEAGNPECYARGQELRHGMFLKDKQMKNLKKALAEIRQQDRVETAANRHEALFWQRLEANLP